MTADDRGSTRRLGGRGRLPVLSALWALSGLRGRLIAALVATAALTLLIAALLVLGPLQHRLRHQEETSLLAAAKAAIPSFRAIDPIQIRPHSPALAAVARALARRIGGTVAILDQNGQVLFSTDPDAGGAFAEAQLAISVNRPVHRTVGGKSGEARVGVPLRVAREQLAISVRKPLNDVFAAVAVVKRAFVTAALGGLAVAVLLGFGLGFTLLRRLRRLREATGLVTAHGPGVELVEDPTHDEIGDLSRAFVRMQTRLAEQEQARRAFVATASHELRTPIASLQAFLELLQDELSVERPDLTDVREHARGARLQSLRLAALAADLLDLSRLDAHVELRREPLELGELSRAVIAEFMLRAADQGHEIRLATGDQATWATADPGAVARILRILLDNSLRYAPQRSEVLVELRESDAGAVLRGSQAAVELRVSDRGPGVPVDERERIFERFQRGSRTAGEGGFGLGLAIGRELARRMDGELLLLDHDAGQGACFCLQLPALRPHERASAQRDGEQPEQVTASAAPAATTR